MAGKLIPESFNGNDINSATYTASFFRTSAIGEIFESAQVSADIINEFPAYVRSQPQGRVLIMRIKINTLSYANVKTLKQWFSTRQGEVILTATNDNSLVVRLSVKPLSMIPVEGTDWMYDAFMWVSKPVWENDTEDDSTQTIDVSGETWAITNDGNDDVRPRTTLTFATTGSAYKPATAGPAKQRHVVVANRSPLPLTDANGNKYPVEVTGGGWDVETKIKAGEMHPQGYDLHVYVNGKEVNRYLSNWGAGYGVGSTANTRIRSFENGATAHHAVRFRLPGNSENETNTVDEVAFFLQRVNPGVALGGTIRAKIWTEVSGAPGAVVTDGTSNTVNSSSVATTLGVISFTFASNPVLTAKTWYWLSIDNASVTNGDASNYIQMASLTTPGYEGMQTDGIKHTADEVTWISLFPSAPSPHNVSDAVQHLAFRVYTTGDAKVWVPMESLGGVKLTLASALRSGGSITNLILSDVEGNGRLSDRCALLIDSDLIICTKPDGYNDRMTIVKMGARGTTAADHAVGAAVYLADLDVRLVFGHVPTTDASSPLGKLVYEPDGLAPVIDGRLSTNETFYWKGPKFAFGSETRPMAWRLEQDDTIELFDRVTLDGSLANDLADITFKDAEAAGDYLEANTAVQHFPTGIEASAAAITLDATPIPASLSLEHLLTNERGAEELLSTYRSADAGTAKTLTPTAEAYRYRARVRNDTITGAEASGGSDLQITSTTPRAQTFTLTEDSEIKGFAFKIKEHASAASDLSIDLYAVNDDDEEGVDTTVKLMPTQTVTVSDTTTSYATISKSLSTSVKLRAGGYAFVFSTSDANGFYLQTSDGSVYSGGEVRTGGQTSIAISADYDAEVQSDGVLDEVGTTLAVGNITLGDVGLRAAIRFPLTDLPDGADVTASVLRMYVTSTNANARAIFPYNSDGQDDPDADTAADMFAACIAGSAYVASNSYFTNAGSVDVTLGSTANTDIENAKALVGRFSVGLRENTETGTIGGAIASIEHATEAEPKLVLTYTSSTSAAYTTRLGQDTWFRVYGTPAQLDTPAGTGDVLSMDNFIFVLDDVTPRTPFVAMQSSDQDCWLLDATLANTTTSQTVELLAIMQAAETLDIDWEARTITHSDDDLSDLSYMTALQSFDENDPFKFEPGSNSLSWTETGLSGSITLTCRTRYREPYL